MVFGTQEQGQGAEPQLSKYNAGVAIQIRLDGLWKEVNSHSRAGLFSKWNADLDRIWSELARDIKENDYKAKKEEFDKFDEELAKIGKFEDNAADQFEKPTKDQIDNRSKQYKRLMEKDLFLKRLENYLGKGTAWDDKEDDDF